MDLIQQVRRNHALEHATIHMLSRRFQGFGAQGNASVNGFFLNLYGDLDQTVVEEAAREALGRLKNGERQWALHPRCGTVLLTTATLATLAGQAVFSLDRMRLGPEKRYTIGSFVNVLPTAIVAAVIAMIVSRPVGMFLQTYTTDGNPGPLEIESVQKIDTPVIGRVFQVLAGQSGSRQLNSYFIKTRT